MKLVVFFHTLPMALRGRPSIYLFFVQQFIIVLHSISQLAGMSIASGLVGLPRCDVVITQLSVVHQTLQNFFTC